MSSFNLLAWILKKMDASQRITVDYLKSGIDPNCSCGCRYVFFAETNQHCSLDPMHSNWSGKSFCLCNNTQRSLAAVCFSLMGLAHLSIFSLGLCQHSFFPPKSLKILVIQILISLFGFVRQHKLHLRLLLYWIYWVTQKASPSKKSLVLLQ